VSNRAYSTFEIKAVDTEQRVIEGIASTPTPDRMSDIVEPLGASFKMPLPLLMRHDSDLPVGEVTYAKPTKEGIPFRARIFEAAPDDPPELKARLDMAWAEVKRKLIRAVSIGFRAIETSFIESTGGIRFTKWEWLELSLVTIPANMDATIQTIKSYDGAAPSPTSGESARRGAVRLSSPAVAGSSAIPVHRGPAMPTMKEQITAGENKRAANVARMEELVKGAADRGETFVKEETEEYANLRAEVKSLDEHLVILRDHEKLMVSKAEPVAASTEGPQPPRTSNPIQLKGNSNLQPGQGFARYVMCLHQAKGNPQMAALLAKTRGYAESSPDVANVLNAQAQGWDVKTAVAGGTTSDTTWASPLAQYTNLASEFVNYLRPQTIFGRLQGLRRVPFMVKIPRQTAGASGYWVGEAAGKPLSKLAFDSITMGPTKMATIVVISDELARVSSPSAELVVRDDLAAALAKFQDEQAFSPGVAGVANTNPASLTYGLTPTTSATSGGSSGTVANVYTDVKAAVGGFASVNIDTRNLVWIMDVATALAIATMQTTIGTPAFPEMSINGGTLLGLPVIVSNNAVHSTSGGAVMILINPSDIIIADDGGVTIDVSNEASLQMADNPTNAAASLVSMFQTNQIAIRAEQYVNYAARRTGAVAYVDMVHY
jgi:HK97 family phage major capsid protein/HK97 family phage prohead protease